MSKVILISDIDTELGYNLLKLYYGMGYQIVGTLSPGRKKRDLKEFDSKSIEIVTWNRTSFIGVKNLLYKGLERFKNIDEALILQSHSFEQDIITDLKITEIEKNIDFWLKGNIFFLKELVSFFSKQGSGSINFVNNLDFANDVSGSLVGELLEMGFTTIINNLFRVLKDSPVNIRGISSSTRNFEAFAEFIIKASGEKSKKKTRIIHFNEKKGIIGNFK